MQTTYRAVMIGGTGQVGQAVVRALLDAPQCQAVLLLCRQLPTIADAPMANEIAQKTGDTINKTDVWQHPKLQMQRVDTSAADFSEQVAALTRKFACPSIAIDLMTDPLPNQGTTTSAAMPVIAISCVGVGRGTLFMPEAKLHATEVGVVRAFAQGVGNAGVAQFCLLSAAGANAASAVKYSRVMGQKEQALQALCFKRLAIFRPGIIVGNQNTPGWMSALGRILPRSWGNILLAELAQAFVQDTQLWLRQRQRLVHDRPEYVIYDNPAMQQLLRANTTADKV